MKKQMIQMVVAVGFSAALTFTSYAAGWTNDGERYSYQFDSGSWAREQLIEIDGELYGFDAQAFMQTGWQNVAGNYYYFEPESGAAAKGWKQLEDKWYYLDSFTGVMKTGFYKEGTKLFYFDENGVMQTGIFYTGGFAYQAEADGSIRRNTDEKSESTGNRIIYEADGKIKFASTLTEAGNKLGASAVYEYLTSPEQMQRWESAQRENLQEAIDEWKENLFEEYKNVVSNTTKAKSHAKKLTKWEDKVNRKLLELGATQEEINGYIYDVKAGNYNRDEDYDNEYAYDPSYYDDEDEDYDYDED